MKLNRTAAAGLATTFLTGGWLVAAEAEPETSNTDETTLLEAQSLLEYCESGQVSAGEIEVLPPASQTEVKDQGWPTTPSEAAERTLTAPAFRTEGQAPLALQEGDPLTSRDDNANVTYQFAAVNEKDDLSGHVVVSEVGFGAYATTHTSFCA